MTRRPPISPLFPYTTLFRSGRLHRLSPPDFPAVRRNEGVIGHILGFKGSHAKALAKKQSAERRHQHGFSDIRAGSLNHKRARRHGRDSAWFTQLGHLALPKYFRFFVCLGYPSRQDEQSITQAVEKLDDPSVHRLL